MTPGEHRQHEEIMSVYRMFFEYHQDARMCDLWCWTAAYCKVSPQTVEEAIKREAAKCYPK